MKKNFFIFPVIAWLSLPPALGQQPPQSDMPAIAHRIAVQIPEIAWTINNPTKTGVHYLSYDAYSDQSGRVAMQVYRYRRPSATTDLILVSHDIEYFPAGAWLECFTHDRRTGALTPTELPFELPPSEQGYWRTAYTIFENGNVLIHASPGMSSHCVMVARWDGKESFALYKRASYDHIDMELGKDDAQAERYVQNVIRPNFQRINATTKWAWVEEGASHTHYYSNNGLEKTVVKLQGNTYECVVEYYFLDGLLSFVYDITTQNGVKTERRWYINGNTCFRGVGNNGQKLTPAQIEEEFLGNGDEGGAYSLYMKNINL